MSPPPPDESPHHRSGLVTFAGIVLILAGSFNILDGSSRSPTTTASTATGCCSATSAWGFWWMFIGLLQAWAGTQVMKLKDVGMMMGIAFAGLNALTHLMFVDAYPPWSS